MWVLLAVLSAILLGLYDVAKKQALRKNGVLAVLLVATALSTLFVSPFLRFGPPEDHLRLALKAVLVTLSWVSGMVGLKLLPLTTVSTIKGSRPVFVVLFSVLLFGERLDWMQWAGVLLVIGALFLLGRTSRDDASVQARRSGFVWMGVSVLSGVASALYDKHIMTEMEPLFVQSWTNLYITILLLICFLVQGFLWQGGFSRTSLCSSLPAKGWAPPVHVATGGHGQAEATLPQKNGPGSKIIWDWTLLLVAVLITGADALYFFSLKQPDALLSIISVIRRASVLVTFVCGALIFKEKGLKAKTLNMLLLAAGVVLLLLGS